MEEEKDICARAVIVNDKEEQMWRTASKIAKAEKPQNSMVKICVKTGYSMPLMPSKTQPKKTTIVRLQANLLETQPRDLAVITGEEDGELQCDYCPLRFLTPQLKGRHIQVVHPGCS